MLFTSGTTGTAEGCAGAGARRWRSFHAYLEYGLDVCASTTCYWNAADPGWAYGLYYAIARPAGRRPAQPAAARRILGGAHLARSSTEFGVTNFAAAPTVYRALRDGAGTGRVRCAGRPAAGRAAHAGRHHLGPGHARCAGARPLRPDRARE